MPEENKEVVEETQEEQIEEQQPETEEVSEQEDSEEVRVAKEVLNNHMSYERAKRVVAVDDRRKRQEEQTKRIQEIRENRDKLNAKAVKIGDKAYTKLKNAHNNLIKAEEALKELDEFIKENKRALGVVNRYSILNEILKERPDDNSQRVVIKRLISVLKNNRFLLK